MSENLKHAILGLICFFLSGSLAVVCLFSNINLGAIAFGLSFAFSGWYSIKKMDAWGNEKLETQKVE